MGFGPRLPAPTDPSSQSSPANASAVGTDLATDLSHQTDRTSYSIPEDGSPITISTRRRRSGRDGRRDAKLARPSQTSLLIEYFEGGPSHRDVQARPSVRVKVTPSSARKDKASAAEQQVQITETGRARQPSSTRRISLTPKAKGDKLVTDSADDRSLSSFASATEESALARRPRAPPVEVELFRDQEDHEEEEEEEDDDDDDASVSASVSAATSPRDSRYVRPNPSEISAMPPDSFLDHAPPPAPVTVKDTTPRRSRSRSLEREGVRVADDRLKEPSRRRSRSLSRDRITRKVIEKLESKAQQESGGAAATPRKRSSKSRSRSVSKEHVDVYKSSSSGGRRRSSAKVHADDDPASVADSSRLTASQLSPSRKSGDQYSFRSGTSKSSVNNTRLLETLEDAIRRVVLPELSALKREQTTQRNRGRFDELAKESVASDGVTSRDGNGNGNGNGRRRVPKVSSAPDVGKQRLAVDREELSRGGYFSIDPGKHRKERRSGRGPAESPSERSSERRVSDETLTEGKVRTKRSKDRRASRDASGAPTGGALTAAALRHHDSKSSIERKERHKRRSKSRSRSASLADDVALGAPDGVPPMPLSSEINGSELTRDSILTARTDRPLSASQEHDVFAGRVVQGGARPTAAVSSGHGPALIADGAQARGGYVARAVELGLAAVARSDTAAPAPHHLRAPDDQDEDDDGRDRHHRHRNRHYDEDDENHLTHRLSLSPIQSVASYKDDSLTGADLRDSFLQARSIDTLSSLGRLSPSKRSDRTVETTSTSASSRGAVDRRRRANSHRQRDSTATDGTRRTSEALDEDTTPKGGAKGPRSYAARQGRRAGPDDARMTTYTNDSLDGEYPYNMATGREILGVGANPEIHHNPVAVSSVVASIHNASVVDVRSNRSRVGEDSLVGSLKGSVPADGDRLSTSQRGSPTRRGGPNGVVANALRNEVLPRAARGASSSPSSESSRDRQTRPVANGLNGEAVMVASSLPLADDPLPEIGHGFEDESEITTNPSIIRGPIGGVAHGNRDHWPYDPTPPRPNGQFLDGVSTPDDGQRARSAGADILATATGVGLGADLGDRKADRGVDFDHDEDPKATLARNAVENGYTDGVNHDFGTRQGVYTPSHPIQETPSKDEGYISAAPVAATPDYKRQGSDLYDEDQLDAILNGSVADDPFTSSKRGRHMSANSHGMASPLYDGATGHGIDRIQSKDIVALMDHLTVRDAQRNARDTEILVTLVRSAAEMRNSFEDMKKLLAESENYIIDSTGRNTERSVHKAVNGPRPHPVGPQRTPRRAYTDEEDPSDLPSKRRNVFRRALKGLSMRSSNDLSKIEEMLHQLLGDVESLKAGQDLRPSGTHQNSLNSYDDLRNTQEGYEPEGQAGTGPSNQSNSAYFSNPPSRQASAMRSMDSGRPHEAHRISTVRETDEEAIAGEEHYDAPYHAPYDTPYDPADDVASPNTQRESLSLESPRDRAPVTAAAATTTTAVVARSSENSPRTEKAEKSKKHRSTASSFFPKISRWSETTASTVARQFRSSGGGGGGGRKDREYSDALSRSGSEVDMWQYPQQDVHDDDRLRSHYSLEDTQGATQETRPPSPLIPLATQEDPKYQAHRDSQNLHHPQPRIAGAKYQSQLESQAHDFDSPISPTSEQWRSNPSLVRSSAGAPAAGNRQSVAGHLSPISDAGYSQTSTTAPDRPPPRPPKVSAAAADPLVPERPPKISNKAAKMLGTDEHRYSNGSASSQMNGSPRSVSGRVQRKPTGPRPISSNR